jgi:predicted transcriptional regulator
MPLGYRSSRVLAVIAAEPGASSREVAHGAEVSDEGQISRLLARLKDLGLIHNPGQWRLGQPHSWRVTARGRRAVPASAATLQRPGS